jgi:hypothetical protein
MNDAAQDQSPTEPQFSRSVEPTLRRHIVMAVRFQRFACKYFCQLEAEVRALCTPDYQRLHKQEISHLIRDNDSKPSWITNHRLEFLLLEGLPPDILAQRARVHRQRLLALAGEEGAAVVGEAFPAPAPDWSVEKLRSQALGVLMEVQRLRHVQSEFGRLRNRLLWVSVVPGFIFISLALCFAGRFPNSPLVASVSVFGLLGGYMSVLMRVGALRWNLSRAANYQQVDRIFWNLSLNFVVSVLQGGLGAIVIYFVFSAKAISSSVFPDLVGSLDQARLLAKGLERGAYVPIGLDLDHQTFAQLMLWSTIAGFSERLVPDLLSGLGKETTAASPVPKT